MLESVERGEWKSTGGGKQKRTRYAKATFRKDRLLNIRLSSKDLEAIQKRALAEGLPYQTLDLEPVAQVRLRVPQGGLILAVPCSFARRMQDIESDTGYDTRRHAPDGALASLSRTTVYDTC